MSVRCTSSAWCRFRGLSLRFVLAEHGSLTMVIAFDRLRSYARRHNLRLSAVAQQVIDTDLAAAVLANPATPATAAATRAPVARKR